MFICLGSGVVPGLRGKHPLTPLHTTTADTVKTHHSDEVRIANIMLKILLIECDAM